MNTELIWVHNMLIREIYHILTALQLHVNTANLSLGQEIIYLNIFYTGMPILWKTVGCVNTKHPKKHNATTHVSQTYKVKRFILSLPKLLC